ncbi:MAG: glycoside hydrolase family 3 N-terminal domain-containing protein [Lachnospiraceae bacterium]
MLNINMSDVMNIVNQCIPQLIFLGVVLVLAIAAMIICKKMPKHKKYMIRRQAGVAMIIGLVITVNAILIGPMSLIVTLATGNGTITEETSKTAEQLVEQVADEGIVLLENTDDILPITDSMNLNVFGWASTNPVYGGTGSGSLSDAYETVTLLQGLENAGYTLNTQLSDFYTAYRADRPVVGMFAQDWTLPEPPASTYTEDLMSSAKEFSDTAVVVIGRVGGEGADLPTDLSAVTYTDNSADYKDFPEGATFLELSATEQDMVDLVCSNFENVVLVYNGANAMELSFVQNYEQIKGVIWCPGTGQTGFNSLGNIIAGNVNPSGKASDTFVKDLTATPTYNNIGNFVYDNMTEFASDAFGTATSPTFVDYVEGIYVGYRYYETAAAEGFITYEDEVLYPFGHGLSYTEFTQEMGTISADADGNISFDVTVTNIGDTAGKDVVEVYYNPPYTNGGIEKSSVNLVEFDKTQMIEPGASETVTITFTAEDMASYDSITSGCYVLEEGEYVISINEDSHTMIDSQIYAIDSTIIYDDTNARSTDNIAAVNQFAHAVGDVTYLSRADGFANYAEATAAPATLAMADELKAEFVNNSNYVVTDFNDANDVMPTTGASNGLELADLRGLEYDDAQWDTLLDQLTLDEMKQLIAYGGYQTGGMSSVGKYSTVDCDGPASINNNFTGVGSIGFPSAVMIASTFNKDIAYAFGESIGTMAAEMNVSGWYAPAMNIHRSAFAGRNFEYYSEDSFLSGAIASEAIKGAADQGVYAYMKHYALNDQEANRLSMLCTWSNEQAIREIYLKPFEMSVKEGGAGAVMSAFNYIGGTYAGADSALLQTVLRDEWGFRGMVLTDYYGNYGYQNADQLIRNGNDFCLATYDAGTNTVVDESATSVIAMRQASKNIMYTVVNSRAYSEEALASASATPGWKIVMIVIDVILAALLILLEVFVIFRGYKKIRMNSNEVIEEKKK